MRSIADILPLLENSTQKDTCPGPLGISSFLLRLNLPSLKPQLGSGVGWGWVVAGKRASVCSGGFISQSSDKTVNFHISIQVRVVVSTSVLLEIKKFSFWGLP